jgi:hypothetical protein
LLGNQRRFLRSDPTSAAADRWLLDYARQHVPVADHTDLRAMSPTSYQSAPPRVKLE